MNSTVKLNVGGEIFTTSMNTLTSTMEANYLSNLVSSHFSKDVDTNGIIFIDRDPKLFKYILHYLRNSKLSSSVQDCELEDLLDEAKFFSITELIELLANKLAKKQLPKYIILTDNDVNIKNFRLSLDHQQGDILHIFYQDDLPCGSMNQYPPEIIKFIWGTPTDPKNRFNCVAISRGDYVMLMCLGDDRWVKVANTCTNRNSDRV